MAYSHRQHTRQGAHPMTTHQWALRTSQDIAVKKVQKKRKASAEAESYSVNKTFKLKKKYNRG